MSEYLFDHDRLDVDRLSIEYVANAFDTSWTLLVVQRWSVLQIKTCLLFLAV